jgi:hypothetical protein
VANVAADGTLTLNTQIQLPALKQQQRTGILFRSKDAVRCPEQYESTRCNRRGDKSVNWRDPGWQCSPRRGRGR